MLKISKKKLPVVVNIVKGVFVTEEETIFINILKNLNHQIKLY